MLSQRNKQTEMSVPNGRESIQRQSSFYNTHLFDSFKRVLVHVCSSIAILVALLWLSLFMYISFYYVYMPAVLHVRDVNLLFRTDCETRDELCSFPTANMSLLSKGQSQLLMRGQTYVIVLEIAMPESKQNKQLGMFIVLLKLYSHGGDIVQSSSRAVMLHYKSTLLHVIETVVRLPSLLIGTSEQMQVITVQMFKRFHEDPYKQTTGAYIEVQHKNVEIYSTTLKIHAQFVGLRYMLFYWPVLSAVMGVATNLFFLSLITLMVWYRLTLANASVSYGEHYELPEIQGANSQQQAEHPDDTRLTERHPVTIGCVDAAGDSSTDDSSTSGLPTYVESPDRSWIADNDDMPLTSSLLRARRLDATHAGSEVRHRSSSQ